MTEQESEQINEPESSEITIKIKTLDKEFRVNIIPQKKIEELKQKIESVNIKNNNL